MSFQWRGTKDNSVLPVDVVSLRYNIIEEAPDGEYNTDAKTLLLENNKFTTRYEHKTGSIVAWINNIQVDATEAVGGIGTPNSDFFISNSETDGFLFIEYVPINPDDYINDDEFSVLSPSKNNNRPTTLDAEKLNSIRNAIETIETNISNRDESYLYTSKQIFSSNMVVSINENTKEQIKEYQDATLHIGNVLDIMTESDTTLNITSIEDDNTYLLKDSYIKELRQALNNIDKEYGIT